MTPEDIRLQEELRKIEELNRQRDAALELAKQAQQRSEAERSREREAFANKAQLESRAAQAQAAQLSREIENRTKALAKEGVDRVLADQNERRDRLESLVELQKDAIDANIYLKPQDVKTQAEQSIPKQLENVHKAIDAATALDLGATVGVAALGIVSKEAVNKVLDGSERRVEEAIAKAPPPSQQMQDQNIVLEEVYRKDREAVLVAQQAKQQAAQAQPQREPTLGERTKALDIERNIRLDAEKQIKRIEEIQADRFKEQARQLGDKYKDDPVKQQEMLAKLEQSRPQHQVQTDRLAEKERDRAEQLVHETLKREGLLEARRANDLAAEKEREARRLEAKRREEQQRNR
ncbi:MAG: hypothetical protein KF859_10535 [Phycisphaeraceae bacterium]|nr:hypothetical protein [Phycisphaeraceae bacterium]